MELYQAQFGLGGLSPRVRGEPSSRRMTTRRPKVYPRVCGGTPRRTVMDTCTQGLSPRVRGNPIAIVGRRSLVRSIPKCAGEQALPARRGRVLAVYPRVCGGTL